MAKNKKIFIAGFLLILLFVGGGIFLLVSGKVSKKLVALKSFSAFEKVVRFLPIENDTKKEISAINAFAEGFTKNDNIERRFLVLLQNNMELRPGGGFLGQYAIVKIKNGEVSHFFIEDANLLDQCITTRVSPPYPFQRMMSIKKWKFRDSNFSPDFPTNVEKAKYFYRLAGGDSDFDGVIAVNADVFNHVFNLTGPITVSGYGEFNSQNAILKLEDIVEKNYIGRDDVDATNRKYIIKKLGPIIIDELFKLNNIPKIAEFALEELRNKNIMLNFKDENLQRMAEEVHWEGKISQDWNGDYLMMADANMGALKSDYHIQREVSYEIDLTTPRPTAILNILYKHNASHGDWRTSDYHSYLRIYVPKGSNLLERKMVSYPLIDEDFDKTYFGFILHVLIGRETNVFIKYELPENFSREDYRLLIQKQSGVGNVPVKVKIKTQDGEFFQEDVLKKDLKFEFK